MKEKRILAMFITSAITLVASLAVTFGVLMTLADPVVATGLVRYSFNIGAKNDNSLIVNNDNTYSLKEKVVFQPTSSIDFDGNATVWLQTNENDKNAERNINSNFMFANESISSKVKVLPIKITNSYSEDSLELSLFIDFDTKTLLGKYTFVRFFNYDENDFEEQPYVVKDGRTITLAPNESVEFAVVVYVDDSTNITSNSINWDDKTNAPLETIDVRVVINNRY